MPTIQTLHENFGSVQRAEIEGFKKYNHQIPAEELERIGERIAQKYIHHLVRNVRELTDNGKRAEYIDMLNQLFQLEKKA